MTKAEIQAEAQKLTPFQRHVCLEKGTERAFTGATTNGYKVRVSGSWAGEMLCASDGSRMRP